MNWAGLSVAGGLVAIVIAAPWWVAVPLCAAGVWLLWRSR